MPTDVTAARSNPTAFLSYSWESELHKLWVRNFATRMRENGVEVTLDQWELHPGDALAAFMEGAVRENDYVLIVCTPHYAERSNGRLGGVGYEGDIMTAEVLNSRNRRKFIPIFRDGDRWDQAAPSWLKGAYHIDLRGNPYSEAQFQDLLTTLHGLRPIAPPVVRSSIPTVRTGRRAFRAPEPFQPLRILGVVVDEIGKPLNDGSVGGALYRVPFQLSAVPSNTWADVFIEKWNRPQRFTTMHRPGIARVDGDKIYLEGTTIEEVERSHRETLKIAVEDANGIVAELHEQQRTQADRDRRQAEEHERNVREVANRIRFD